MVRKVVFALIFTSFLFASLSKLQAQAMDTSPQELTFNMTAFNISTYSSVSTTPQWVRDLRRFDIIAFGTFPFTMLFTTIGYDMYLRNNSLPTPNNYYGNVMLISAGASITLALVDYIIIRVKRSKERRRLESIESGTYEIETMPYGDPVPDESPPD